MWDPSKAPDGAWMQSCGVALPVNLYMTGLDCIYKVMQSAGAKPQAIAFLREYGYFLYDFKEEGTVDYGRGAAPWFNMGRPTQQLALNGTPRSYELSENLPSSWQRDASYAPAVQQQAFPWTEYGTLASVTAPASGGQIFEMEYSLRICRACPNVGYLVVDYSFSGQGVPGAITVKPMKQP